MDFVSMFHIFMPVGIDEYSESIDISVLTVVTT